MATKSYVDVEGWLIGRVSQLLHIDESNVSIDQPFADFGLDSSLMIAVTHQLSQWIGRELSVTAFWEYPTISGMAKALAEGVVPQSHEF